MEGISVHVYKGLRNYWNKRRGYLRLNDAVRQQAQKRRRVRIRRRIRIFRRVGSPKKWFTRLRDAYVKMMLNLANSGGLMSSRYGGSLDYGSGLGLGPGKGSVKEYDERVIVEIYKSLVMAQGQLVPRQTPELASRPAFSSLYN